MKYIDLFRGERVIFTRFDGKEFTGILDFAHGPLEDGEPPKYAQIFIMASPVSFEECVEYSSRGQPNSFRFVGEPLAASYVRDVTDHHEDELFPQASVLSTEEIDGLKSGQARSIVSAQERELARMMANDTTTSQGPGQANTPETKLEGAAAQNTAVGKQSV